MGSAAAAASGEVKLTPPGASMASGGTVSHRVFLDGRWIGWVYDQRPWRGHRHGARRWDATWREDGDWNARVSRTGCLTRQAAIDTLVELVSGATS